MNSQRFEQRLAGSGTFKIKKYSTSDHGIFITKLWILADGTGQLTVSDTVKTYTFDLVAGQPVEFCMGLLFDGANDVTFTAVTVNMTVFAEATYKK